MPTHLERVRVNSDIVIIGRKAVQQFTEDGLESGRNETIDLSAQNAGEDGVEQTG